MGHELSHSDAAPPWPIPDRRLDWVAQIAAAAARRVRQWSGMANGRLELRMSREWLDEHERRSNSSYDGI
jgi:hypothetical protein